MKKTIWILLAIILVVTSGLIPLPFLTDRSGPLSEKLADYSKRAKLNCYFEIPSLLDRMLSLRKVSTAIQCEDHHFAFSDGRDGTAKSEVTEEFLAKVGELTKRTWHTSNVSIGFIPDVGDSDPYPLTCYFSRTENPGWFTCKSQSCDACSADYPMAN